MKKCLVSVCLSLIGAGFCSSHVLAAPGCTAAGGGFTYSTPIVLTVARDAPDYTPLGEEIRTPAYNLYNCEAKFSKIAFGVKGHNTLVGNIGTSALYSSGIPGVAYTIGVQFPSVLGNTYNVLYSPTVIQSIDGNQRNIIALTRSTSAQDAGTLSVLAGTMAVRFYKLGTLTQTSSVNNKSVGSFIAYNDDIKAWIYPEQPLTLSSLTVKYTACETPKSITVALSPVEVRSLTGVGSFAQEKAFTIRLSNCSANLNVTMRIDPNSVAGSSNASNGLLNPNSTSTATGVSLQLLKGDNTAVALGTAFRAVAPVTAAGGSYDIPFKVRYHQTGTKVTPGTISATATYTMIYN